MITRLNDSAVHVISFFIMILKIHSVIYFVTFYHIYIVAYSTRMLKL